MEAGQQAINHDSGNSGLHTSRFSSGLRALAIGASSLAIAVGATGLSGCSPQEKSFWTGAYTKLPDPPPNARMQIGVSTEEDGTVFINYVAWDSSQNLFVRKDVHYTTAITHPGSYTEAGGYEQRIIDGEVLSSGAVVDQKNGFILLPGGLKLEGTTGNVMTQSGTIVKALGR